MPAITSSGKKQEKQPPPKSEYILGLNLLDISHINEHLRYQFLKDRLNLKEPVRLNKDTREDVFLVFTCDTLLAALTIDLIRSEQRKANEAPVRAYIHKKAWKKLPNDAVLTVLDGETPTLNPDVFNEKVEIAEGTPLEADTI